MTWNFKNISLLASACISAGAWVSVVHAAQTDGASADNPEGLVEIMVTAQRRAEPLSRVGVTVTAVTAQELAVADIKTPGDLARIVPGFQSLESASTGAPVFVLRGVGFDSPTPATSSPVGIYVDEVAYAYPYMSLGVAFDLERVEVLKGPQGTLFGRNATGGLVNFIAAKPTRTFEGSITAGYGNYGTAEVKSYVSGPITDTLSGRLAFELLDREQGWQRSVTRDDQLGVSRRYSTRATLNWTPSAAVDVTATGTAWQLRGDTQAPQAIEFVRDPKSLTPEMAASLIPNVNDARLADWTPASRQPNADLMRQFGIGASYRPPFGQDTRFFGEALRVNIKLNDTITLASLTSDNDLRYLSIRDFGGLQTESLTQKSTGTIKSFEQELRLLGDMGKQNWSVGAYYGHDNNTQQDLGWVGELSTIVELKNTALFVNTLFPNPLDPNLIKANFRNYAGYGNSKVDVIAGFANAEIKISDSFKLRGGLRSTHDKETGSSCALDVNGGQLALINLIFPLATGHMLPPATRNGCYTLNATNTNFVNVQNSQRDTNLAWRVAADFTPSEDTLFYAIISRGFKSGSFPVFAAANASQLAPVRPEQLTAFEAGSKLRLLERALQVNSSVFYYDYKDRQTFGRVPDLVFGSLLRIINIPKSKVYGAEADINFRASQYLTARGSAAYVKSAVVGDFVGFDVRSQQGIVTNFKSASLPYNPKFQLSSMLIADVPVPAGDGVGLLGALNVSYQSASSAVLGREPGYDIAAYSLVGAQLGVHGAAQRWSVEGYVNNLLDKYYWVSAQRGNETTLRYAGMPRTYGIRGSIKF
ncbi:MAG: TonB-dependent receptor [Pseudomonadota bacterium]|nr:TonB-dependent receptor [Pseudomonadota bacterium]